MRDMAIVLGFILLVLLVDRAINLTLRAIEARTTKANSRMEREIQDMFSAKWTSCDRSEPTGRTEK